MKLFRSSADGSRDNGDAPSIRKHRAWVVHTFLFVSLLAQFAFAWPWVTHNFYNYLESGGWPPEIFLHVGKLAFFVNNHFIAISPLIFLAVWVDRWILQRLATKPVAVWRWNMAVLTVLTMAILIALYALAAPGIMILQVRYQ